jgi:hypothetical protein
MGELHLARSAATVLQPPRMRIGGSEVTSVIKTCPNVGVDP